jgi:two-component system cell cycle sensor histidine kinase/response regulator CckA
MNPGSPDREVLGLPFAKSPYPMWIFDRETLAFLDVNDAAIKEYGYSRQEFLSMTIRNIRPASDLPELLRQTQNPRPKGQSTAETWRHQTKYGTVFPVTITSWELTFHGRPAELVLARRMSETK